MYFQFINIESALIYNINKNRKEWVQLLLAISTTIQINNLNCTIFRIISFSWCSIGSINSTTSSVEFSFQFWNLSENILSCSTSSTRIFILPKHTKICPLKDNLMDGIFSSSHQELGFACLTDLYLFLWICFHQSLLTIHGNFGFHSLSQSDLEYFGFSPILIFD